MHKRVHLRIDTAPAGSAASRTLAVTVHLPKQGNGAPTPPLIVGLPGGGYNRRYFDLDEPGYSQAGYHVEHGSVFAAIDHLGVGESDIPEPAAGLEDVAAANDAAIRQVLARLRSGELADGTAAIVPAAVIGIAHSMGGHIAVHMQASRRSFDALAVLGASAVSTRLPARRQDDEIDALKGRGVKVKSILADFDWRYAFHWEDVPEHLAGVDAAYKPFGKGPVPAWRSATAPAVEGLMQAAYFARDAAAIDVPVLLAMGERDVNQDPLRELAAYMATRDLSIFICRGMAHMHNFAGTRVNLWRRLDAFVKQAAAAASAG